MSATSAKEQRAKQREEAAREREQQERRKRVRRLAGAAAGLLAVVLAVILLAGGSDDGGGTPESVEGAAEISRLLDGIPQDGLVLGDPGAPATLVEFVDPQCPYCADAARDVLPAIVNEEVRNGRLNLELQVLTFIGPDSEKLGAFFAGAALQDKAWHLSEVAFRTQSTENTGWATDDVLEALGGAVPGLDVAKAIDQGNSAAGQQLLARSRAAAQRSNVTSTPSFLVRQGDALKRLELTELTPDALRAALRKAGVRGVAG